MSVSKDFHSRHLIVWQHRHQSIRSNVRKFLWTNMVFDTVLIRSPGPTLQGLTVLVCFGWGMNFLNSRKSCGVGATHVELYAGSSEWIEVGPGWLNIVAQFILENRKINFYLTFLDNEITQIVYYLHRGRRWPVYPTWSKHGFWWPGEARSHGIVIVVQEYSGFTRWV